MKTSRKYNICLIGTQRSYFNAGVIWSNFLVPVMVRAAKSCADLPSLDVSFPRSSGKELVPSSSAKDLGVILDPHLTFEGHVLKTVSYCMSSVAHINFFFPLCSGGRRLFALKYIVS